MISRDTLTQQRLVSLWGKNGGTSPAQKEVNQTTFAESHITAFGGFCATLVMITPQF